MWAPRTCNHAVTTGLSEGPKRVATPAGLEPATYRLEVSGSELLHLRHRQTSYQRALALRCPHPPPSTAATAERFFGWCSAYKARLLRVNSGTLADSSCTAGDTRRTSALSAGGCRG